MKRPYRWWICLNSKLKTQHLKLAYSAFGVFADPASPRRLRSAGKLTAGGFLFAGDSQGQISKQVCVDRFAWQSYIWTK